MNEDFIEKLDFSTMVLQDKQFVGKDHERREADLLYKVNYQGRDIFIYLLMEFQSTIDGRMAFRFLRYILDLYEWLERKKRGRLPVVFPLLLYNGETKWTAKEDTRDLIGSGIPVEFIPRFRYYKIAVNELDDSFLEQMRSLVDAALYIEKNRDIEGLSKKVALLFDLFHDREPLLWKELAGFAGSLFSKTGEIDPIIERLNNKEEVTSMIQTALKEHDAKIREQGIIQGIEKGSREMAAKTARNLLNMGLSIKQIAKVIELSEEDVTSLLSRG